MNSRIFCYQVIPCLQWLQKWLDVNHAVNNTPIQKADATANCRAWDAQWNHNNLSASVRSLGLSPSLTTPARQDAVPGGTRAVPSAAPTAESQGGLGTEPAQGCPHGRGVLAATTAWANSHRASTRSVLLKYLPFVSISTSLPLKINNLVWKPWRLILHLFNVTGHLAHLQLKALHAGC